MLISGSEVTAERRVQIYTPDYLLTGKPRPLITAAPSQLNYGQQFGTAFTNVPDINRVVLLRLAGATHGNHFDQREVVLACSNSTSSVANCAAPPNSSIAPPGQYMLFVLLDGVPSRAKYVALNATAVVAVLAAG